MIHEKACPICGSDDFKRALQEWFTCRECGCAFQTPHMSDEEMAQYYETSYRDKDYPTDAERMKLAERAIRQFMFMRQAGLGGFKRVLDFACGGAYLLNKMRDAYGCEVYGIELNPIDHIFAEQRNIPMYYSLDTLPVKDFDLIIASHILEHFTRPQDMLSMLTEYAAAESYLLIEVPDIRSQSAWAKFHLTVLPYKTIERILDHAGWSLLKHTDYNLGHVSGYLCRRV